MAGDGDVSQRVRALVVARLRVRRDGLVGEIFARVGGDAFGSVGVGDAEYVEGLRAAVGAAVDYALEGIERGEARDGLTPAVAVEQARRAARAGVSLDTVLRRYVLGSALVGECIIEEAHRDLGDRIAMLPRQREALRDALRVQSVALDRLMVDVSRAYGVELERAGRGAVTGLGGSGVIIERAVGDRRELGARSDAISNGARRSQKDRVLQAMVEVVAERGFEHVAVRLVTERAGVSRRSFYECFAGLDECWLAIVDRMFEHLSGLVSRGFEGERSWLGGMRVTLGAVLAFLDTEPGLARVFVVEALGAGPLVRERREHAIERLRLQIVARIEGEVTHVSPLEPEGVIASVTGIVQARLTMRESRQPLLELLGPLMGIIVRPFMGHRQVMREIEKGDRLARELRQTRELALRGAQGDESVGEERVAVPPALLDSRASRLRVCLVYVVWNPGVSNQEVGVGIGVPHRGQVTKLLHRLAALGLLSKRCGAPGYPNAWSATTLGEQAARALRTVTDRWSTGINDDP